MILEKLAMMNYLIGLVIITQINSLLNLDFGLVENLVLSNVRTINPISHIITFSASQNAIIGEICYENLKEECIRLITMSNGRPINESDLAMKITFRQSGGYSGLIRGCEINSELLTSKEAKKLESLVDQSGFFEARSKKTPNAADLLEYQIIIETIDRKHQLSFDQTSLPDEFIPLLNFLQDRSGNIN